MPSLKERMAAFKEASSPDKFEKEKQQKTPSPRKRTGRSVSPPPNFLTNHGSGEKKKPVKGKVVPNRVSPMRERPKDWKYLYELATRYDQYKLQEAEEKKVTMQTSSSSSSNNKKKKNEKDIKNSLEGIIGGNYTAKADWLNKGK